MKLSTFQPDVNFSNGILTIRIPEWVLAEVAHTELQVHQGRIKDTEFNRVDLSDLKFSLRENGCRVKGNWRIQHRERLIKNPFTGGWTHTDWLSMSGNFHQNFDLSVKNGRLEVRATSNQIGSCKWYGDLVEALASFLDAGGKLRNSINRALQHLNGLDIYHLIIDQGSHEIECCTGLNLQQMRQLIEQHLESINAKINNGNLVITLHLKLPQ